MDHLIKDEVQIGARRRLGIIGGTAHNRPFASGGDAGVSPRDIGEGQALAPLSGPCRREFVPPLRDGRVEGNHVVFGRLHQGLFLEKLRVVVHEAPQEKRTRLGHVAHGTSRASAGGIPGYLDPAVRRQGLGPEQGEAGQRNQDASRDAHGPIRISEPNLRTGKIG